MIKELNGLLALMRHDQHGQYDNPNRVTADYADRLEAIIRKYEDPTDAMVKAGGESLINTSGVRPRFRALACWKAMMEAEDESHE